MIHSRPSDMYIPYGRQTISEEDIRTVEKVLKSDFLTQGEEVPGFENELAHKVGAKYATACNSATSALHLACLALGVAEGDIVWTTPITFVASANCALYCKAEVDFVDIERKTGLIDVQALSEKLIYAEHVGRLPKVLIPVHLCGTSCDMKEISRLAHKYGVKVLEDASHAIGGGYLGETVGSCAFSDITVFSFHPVKIITTGEGGAAVTNCWHTAEKMRALRSHGITKDPTKFETEVRGPWQYEQQSLGYNYRMTDIQAALGRSQLKRLESFIKKRHEIIEYYQGRLSGTGVELLQVPSGSTSAYHLAVIRMNECGNTEHLRVFNGLRQAGIGVQLHYEPVHTQPFYRRIGFERGDFQESERYAEEAISLPIYPELNNSQLCYIVDRLLDLV